MRYIGTTNEYFEVVDSSSDLRSENPEVEGQLSMLWFRDEKNTLVIDAEEYSFKKNEIIFLTPFHKAEIKAVKDHRYLRFNVPFYCILDHDSEVGCKGVLFYGAKDFPHIRPTADDVDILETVWKMLTIEMRSSDNLQLEMLQMMLKRILILCTRIYKTQENYAGIDDGGQVDVVREYNFLVETHFKEKHSVSDYATLLNKSPKTLSNLFGKISDKTPLQIIQNRIMLEVRRMLRYTDRPISEIGYEVGFNDVQSFSRFFKKNQGMSPSDFRVT